MLTVRLLPLPPKRMFSGGTRTRFEERPVRVKPPAAVWESPILKARGPVGLSSVVVLFAIAEIVGEVLVAAFTKTVKTPVTTLLEGPPSSTVIAIMAVPRPVVAGLKRTLPEAPGLV